MMIFVDTSLLLSATSRFASSQDRPDPTVDFETQALCYEAFFRTFWHQPWFAGSYFWKWYPSLTSSRHTPPAIDFTPQGKPAEGVMTRWYGHP